MGTTNYTKVNFTLLEIMHLIGRVELMNDIMYFKLAEYDICFPRNPISKMELNVSKLPSDKEIETIIETACNVALNDAKNFGIHSTPQDIKDCQLRNVQTDVSFNDDDTDDYDENHIDNATIDLGIASNFETVGQINFENFKDYSDRDITENSPFVKVGGSNKNLVARKSTIIWAASNSKEKISSDRLERVQKKKTARRQLEFVSVPMNEGPVYRV